MSQQPLHVVFGAGQIGSLLARVLQQAGARVRVVRRSAREVGPGIEVLSGDALDPAFVVSATKGAAVIYHCMNASQYSARQWETELPRMGDSLIAAAVHHGARLVVLDNLYGYGEVEGRRTETTPLTGTGRKARVRSAWAARLEQARQKEGLKFVTGRGGDFFGPGADQAVISDATVKAIAAGKRPLLLGDATAPHAFSYVRDVAAALAALGLAEDDVEGRVFHLPVLEVAPAELVARLASALGRTTRPRVVRRWAVVGIAPFVPLVRELLETLYQWERPFLVDDSAFRKRFPHVGVSLEQAVAESVAQVIDCPRPPHVLPAGGSFDRPVQLS